MKQITIQEFLEKEIRNEVISEKTEIQENRGNPSLTKTIFLKGAADEGQGPFRRV